MQEDPTTKDIAPSTRFRPAQTADLEAIARDARVEPLASLDELALDVWESDEELDAFLADLRASRDSGLA